MTTSINTASLNRNTINRKAINRKAIRGSAIETIPMAAPACKSRLMRQLARKWDLYGVVALMASSAAYGVFALAHVA